MLRPLSGTKRTSAFAISAIDPKRTSRSAPAKVWVTARLSKASLRLAWLAWFRKAVGS